MCAASALTHILRKSTSLFGKNAGTPRIRIYVAEPLPCSNSKRLRYQSSVKVLLYG